MMMMMIIFDDQPHLHPSLPLCCFLEGERKRGERVGKWMKEERLWGVWRMDLTGL